MPDMLPQRLQAGTASDMVIDSEKWKSLSCAIDASNDIRLSLPEYERAVFDEGFRMGVWHVKSMLLHFVSSDDERRDIEEALSRFGYETWLDKKLRLRAWREEYSE